MAEPADAAEKETAGTSEVQPKIQWHSNRCVKVAAILPLPRSASTEKSQNRLHSPALTSSPTRSTTGGVFSSPVRSRHVSRRNLTRLCPFSFDLRDSMQRVARDERMERLRLQEESHITPTFRANPVRKYKPLVLQQSSRLPTVPRSPFSHRDPLK